MASACEWTPDSGFPYGACGNSYSCNSFTAATEDFCCRFFVSSSAVLQISPQAVTRQGHASLPAAKPCLCHRLRQFGHCRPSVSDGLKFYSMKLLTKEILSQFENHPIGSQDGKGMDAKVLVKYFNPCGAGTWLITEAEKQPDGDWLLFGYCHIHEWEWGYVVLSELQSLRLPLGLTIERDIYSSAKTVGEFIR